ncbi:MAG: HD domain-containing protein [Ruminococcaceae bacterium]|nr:HD domain-containing protein [Oscillospiraceae bacterium]
MVTFENIKNNTEIQTYIIKADESLRAIGYTEHSFAHVEKVSGTAGEILRVMGYSDREVELAMIAGYMHDIGNLINRVDHSQSGALMSFRILEKMGMEPEEIATVITAIGNHDEGDGMPVNPVSAALIIADKTDVRRSRVRNTCETNFDIHDRVNYSVKESSVKIDPRVKEITLELILESRYSTVMDYFEIFLHRMIMCRKAAERLGLSFRLVINGQNIM